jgi:membrane associated rhomboid family serine protease
MEPSTITDKRKLILSLYFPIFFVLIIWSVKIIEIALNTSFVKLGVYPLKAWGLIGILTSPLIHSNFEHLINNTIPLLILSVATFYFYRPLGYKVFFWTYLMTGLWVWCGAREAYHIGASGIVYGLAFFLFFSGVFRRIIELAAVSLIVVFLYGSMIWGIFPFVPDVSWESHLSGGLAGLILALVYRNDGPQPKRYDWEVEDDDDFSMDDENDIETTDDKSDTKPEDKIIYIYKPKDDKP